MNSSEQKITKEEKLNCYKDTIIHAFVLTNSVKIYLKYTNELKEILF